MKEILNKALNLSKNTRLLAVIGLSCTFLCIFFTYIKYTVLGLAVKIRLIDYFEGKVMILLIILSLMFIFEDYVKKYIPKLFENKIGKKIETITDQRLTLIPTALIVIFALVVKSETDVEFLNYSYGLGFYLLSLGVISLVAYAFLYKKGRMQINSNIGQNNVTNANSTSGVNMGVEVKEQNNNIQNNLVNASEASITEDKKEVEVKHKFCTNCGSKCDENALKCPACGKEF